MIGWLTTGFEFFGFILGGVVGVASGSGLRALIRAEVAKQTADLRAQLVGKSAPFADQPIRRSWGDEIPITTAPAEKPATEAAPAPMPAPPPSTPPTPDVPREAESVVTRAEPTKEELVREMAFSSPFTDKKETQSDQAEPSQTATSDLLDKARIWLLGGNTIVRVGLIVLFVGLSFLASYAASAGLFPVELRLALVGLFGAGLIAFGFKTRQARPQYGLALQGGGVATIYLTLYATAKLIDTASPVAVFVLMILVCGLGCALALLQRSQALAATSFIGGYAVPLLLSTGGGDVAGLFAYYSILNLAILLIAVQRSWRIVNLIGFASTFGILTLVVGSEAAAEQFLVTQAFLILSVLIYVITAVLYTRMTPNPAQDSSGTQSANQFGNLVDTTLLFGTALIGFGLEVSLVGDRPFGSAFAALGFSGLYLALAAYTSRYLPQANRLLSEALLAVGVVFVTLAVPLALGARWTSIVWALEGAGAFWIGMRQARWLPRLFGLALQVLAAGSFAIGLEENVSAIPLANPAFMGALIVALPALITAYWLRNALPHLGSPSAIAYAKIEESLEKPAFFVGFGFWCLAWGLEIHRLQPSFGNDQVVPYAYPIDLLVMLTMLAFLVSALGFQFLGRRLQWPVAIWPSGGSFLALLVCFLGIFSGNNHILYYPDWILWTIAIALHIWMLYVNDHHTNLPRSLLTTIHLGSLWLGILLLGTCVDLGLDRAKLWGTSWAGVAFLAILTAVLIGLSWVATRRINPETPSRIWPLRQYSRLYGWQGAGPIAVLVGCGATSMTMLSSGDASPLPYIPLFNPVELTVGFAFAGLMFWRHHVIAAGLGTSEASWLAGRQPLILAAAILFIAINMAWLRATHHYLGIDWSPDALFANFYVQTGLAILWTVLALPLMVIAHRRRERQLWLVGASLLGLTVAKLLLVDLNNTGGGARIIAFIGVGVLMLIVGYLAPLPPRPSDPDGGVPDDTANEKADS